MSKEQPLNLNKQEKQINPRFDILSREVLPVCTSGEFYRDINEAKTPDSEAEVLKRTRDILQELPSADKARFRELAREMNNIWYFNLPLSKEEKDFFLSSSVLYESIRRQAEEQRLDPISEKSLNLPTGEVKSLIYNYRHFKEGLYGTDPLNPGRVLYSFDDLRTSPQEFERVGQLLGLSYARAYLQEADQRKKDGETARPYTLEQIVGFKFRTINLEKAFEILSQLPENTEGLKELKEAIAGELPLAHEEHARALAEQFKNLPSDSAGYRAEEFLESVHQSGKPLEHFGISEKELRIWEKLPVLGQRFEKFFDEAARIGAVEKEPDSEKNSIPEEEISAWKKTLREGGFTEDEIHYLVSNLRKS